MNAATTITTERQVSLSCAIDEHGACFHPEQCGCRCHELDEG